MHYASKAYAKIAKEIAGPRELEANLLLQATAKLQAVQIPGKTSAATWTTRSLTIAVYGLCSSTPWSGMTINCRRTSAKISKPWVHL